MHSYVMKYMKYMSAAHWQGITSSCNAMVRARAAVLARFPSFISASGWMRLNWQKRRLRKMTQQSRCWWGICYMYIICMCMCVYICICICKDIYIYVSIHIYIHIHTYIHIYVYIYTYVYIHVNIYILSKVSPLLWLAVYTYCRADS